MGKPDKQEKSRRGMMRRRMSHGLLLVALLSALSLAEAQEAAPRFTAKTLGGETFTSHSLKGRVTLLQFWATWCPHCRGDQSDLDSIAREFAGRGLVVLAVDVGESEQTVKEYLGQHPRSCPIVLTDDTDLVATYDPKGFPSYVLIDRDGNIAGTQEGAGGAPSLRALLTRVGLGRSSVPAGGGADRRSTPQAPHPSSPKLIEAPQGQSVPRVKSLPPAVFVLRNGEKLEAHNYTIAAGSLHVGTKENQRTIPLTEVDLKATLAANHARGIDLKIPTNQNDISLGF